MDVNGVSRGVIGAAIEVHRTLGPGLLESAYEACLSRELALRDIAFVRQKALPVEYTKLQCSLAQNWHPPTGAGPQRVMTPKPLRFLCALRASAVIFSSVQYRIVPQERGER